MPKHRIQEPETNGRW